MGCKGLRASFIIICPIALKAVTSLMTSSFFLLANESISGMNAWSDSWSLNISLDGIDFLFACVFDSNDTFKRKKGLNH